MIIVSVAALAACAGQPSNPPAHYAPEATTAALAAAGAAPSDPLAERLAAAKKLGYTVVNTDGELLYCRSDLKTGSHVQKETTCLTAAQLDHLHDQSRLDLQNYLKPNMPPK